MSYYKTTMPKAKLENDANTSCSPLFRPAGIRVVQLYYCLYLLVLFHREVFLDLLHILTAGEIFLNYLYAQLILFRKTPEIIITIERQYALGLKSLPRATITPSSSIFLARGCFSLEEEEKMSVSRAGSFAEQMTRMEEKLRHPMPSCSRRRRKLKVK
jgi:hypothetical protein